MKREILAGLAKNSFSAKARQLLTELAAALGYRFHFRSRRNAKVSHFLDESSICSSCLRPRLKLIDRWSYAGCQTAHQVTI